MDTTFGFYEENKKIIIIIIVHTLVFTHVKSCLHSLPTKHSLHTNKKKKKLIVRNKRDDILEDFATILPRVSLSNDFDTLSFMSKG